jgi:hypothetical protein
MSNNYHYTTFESPVDSSHEEVTLFKNVKVYKDCQEGGYYYV